MAETYKSSNDANFIFAAKIAIGSLGEAVSWCDMLLKKCEGGGEPIPLDYETYRDLIYKIIDPDYEKKQAESYRGSLVNAIDVLEHPEKSTAEQRRDCRINITMCYTWALNWNAGADLRDKMTISTSWEFAPSLTGVRYYYAPSQIAQIAVGDDDLTPGYHPFDDNQ